MATATLRVLVVEDADDVADLVQTLLAGRAPATTEVVVETSPSLTAAARRLGEEPRPDVALLDIALPDVPGATPVAGVAALAAMHDAPPIVAVVPATDDRGLETVAAGAVDVLTTTQLGDAERLWHTVVVAVERDRRRRTLAIDGEQLFGPPSQLAHLSSRLKHDLRAPLAIAISALDTIQHAQLDDAGRDRMLGMMTTRLHDLAGRLEDLAGALREADADGHVREAVSLDEVAREVVEDLAPWDRGRLSLDVAGSPTVWGDRRVLRGLVGGLVRNALQHNPQTDVTVHLEHRTEDGRAVLVVADDGIGIDPEVRDAVFDVGWTTTDPPSLGIGLAAASSAVTMMEGTIRVVDSPYGGAAFRIELPQRHAG